MIIRRSSHQEDNGYLSFRLLLMLIVPGVHICHQSPQSFLLTPNRPLRVDRLLLIPDLYLSNWVVFEVRPPRRVLLTTSISRGNDKSIPIPQIEQWTRPFLPRFPPRRCQQEHVGFVNPPAYPTTRQLVEEDVQGGVELEEHLSSSLRFCLLNPTLLLCIGVLQASLSESMLSYDGFSVGVLS